MTICNQYKHRKTSQNCVFLLRSDFSGTVIELIDEVGNQSDGVLEGTLFIPFEIHGADGIQVNVDSDHLLIGFGNFFFERGTMDRGHLILRGEGGRGQSGPAMF